MIIIGSTALTDRDAGKVVDVITRLDGKHALAVDATLSGATVSVALDKSNDSVSVWSNTAKDGTGTNYQPLVDSDGKLKVVVDSIALASSSSQNSATIVLSGTAVQLPSISSKSFLLQADVLNTDLVYLGTSSVSGSVYGVALSAGESISVDAGNSNIFYFNGISGSKLRILAVV